MRAALLPGFGGPDVLQIEGTPMPTQAIGEVFVKVLAAGVNPIDAKTRAGGGAAKLIRQFPAIIGVDFCGVVEKRAFDSHPLQPGALVYGLLPVPRVSGSYAEYATAHVSMIARAPSSVSPTIAAGLPCAALTAWGCVVSTGKVERGQRVLIHAGAGGVGHVAVQLAKRAGAHVVATASARNVDWLLQLGADEVIDYSSKRFEVETGDIDLVIDLIGNVKDETGTRSLKVMRKGGLLISVPTGSWPTFREEAAAAGMRASDIKAISDTSTLNAIAAIVDSGELKLEVSETLPLAQVAGAHELLERGHVRGKIVLEIP